MANESTIQSSLQITNGNLKYRSFPTSFNADVSGAAGPEPGLVIATTTGVTVNFPNLTTPGLVHIRNLDSSNYLSYGIYDSDTSKYYPLGEILPGESYVLRFSRDLQEEFGTAGTGTTGDAVNRLMVRGNAQSVNCVIEAFEA